MGILLNKSKNYIINGAMDFWQRGTSFAAIANGAYFTDRFEYFKSGTMVHTASRDTDVPTLAQSSFTFPYSMRMNLTTAQASLTAAQFVAFSQRIEGQIFAPLTNKKITISFWVKATLVGQYSFALRNTTLDRTYVSPYVVNTSNTWEKKTITIQHDNTGTWDYGTGTGLEVYFTLSSGSQYVTSSTNTWLSGNFISATGSVNGVQAGATDFRITGIQLEEGVSSSNFERAGGNTLTELALCQRYYEKSYDLGVNPGTNTQAGVWYTQSSNSGNIDTAISFGAIKRVTPSVQVYSSTGAAGVFRNESGAVDSSAGIASQGQKSFRLYNLAGITANARCSAHWTADAEL